MPEKEEPETLLFYHTIYSILNLIKTTRYSGLKPWNRRGYREISDTGQFSIFDSENAIPLIFV